jgi:hypothetical protein
VAASALGRAAPALICCAAVLLAGCGSKKPATGAGIRLQREDLAAVASALSQAAPRALAEAAATKAVWPLVAGGLPADLDVEGAARIAAASRAAHAVELPPLFTELTAKTLTGPGVGIANAFRSFLELSRTSWQMIVYTLTAERGGGEPGRFARANVALYIESVYDANFGLAQIGKNLMKGYEQVGGPAAFGETLSAGEVRRLASIYSEPNFRLHPHDGVRLGS